MSRQLETLNSAISQGNLAAQPKYKLEEFADALCASDANTHFNAGQMQQVSERIRLLLARCDSRENDARNKRESRIAIFISVVAVLAGIFQGVVGYMQLRRLDNPSPVIIQQPTPAHVEFVAPKK